MSIVGESAGQVNKKKERPEDLSLVCYEINFVLLYQHVELIGNLLSLAHIFFLDISFHLIY